MASQFALFKSRLALPYITWTVTVAVAVFVESLESVPVTLKV
jgi:hypothetical protein